MKSGDTPHDPGALFAEYDRHPDDHQRLLRAVADSELFERVLYPGSYIDVSPSFVFRDVTYVDTDRRAARFFSDRPGVDRLVRSCYRGEGSPTWRFLHADYTDPLDVPIASMDLVISLYAGFVSEHCTLYLRAGGCLLANNSHGDASLASLDSRNELVAVVVRRASGYRIEARDLQGYLDPHDPAIEVTADLLRKSGRGVRYRRSAAAYLFRRR